MASFVMFGKYSSASMMEISADRTVKVVEMVKNYGGVVKSIHALLGEYDLILIVELPSVSKAMECSVALFKLTGISFTTSPAVEVEAFDKLAQG